MSGNKVWVSEAHNVDAISGETILGTLAAGGDVRYSMFEMFQGAIPGSIAETSTLWVGSRRFNSYSYRSGKLANYYWRNS